MHRNAARRAFAPAPRIAITGSAGVGKSTLATHVAAAIGVPFLAEGMRARLEAGLDLHTLTRDGLRALLQDLFAEALQAEEHALAAAGGFVADRCALDHAAFWLYYGFGFDDGQTSRVFERAQAALMGYERIFVLPWGAIALDADGVRTANPWPQLHYQALLEGLLIRFAPKGRVVRVPMGIRDLNARIAFVLDRVAKDRVAKDRGARGARNLPG